MASVALVWLRRDLRVHDHPPLHAALAQAERVLCVFCLDERLLAGRLPSARRTRALLTCLAELRETLRERGGELILCRGEPERELVALARETGADQVHFASDVSPFAMARDRCVEAALRAAGVQPRRAPGHFIADVGKPRDRDGRPFTVFSPFWRAWRTLERRPVLPAPDRVPAPDVLPDPGAIPTPEELGATADPLTAAPEPVQLALGATANPLLGPPAAGEAAARARLEAWLASPELQHYDRRPPDMANATSALSVALHLGSVSAREVEHRVEAARAHAAAHDTGPRGGKGGRGHASFLRQLAWRDFYAHVLLHHPRTAHGPFQERMADLPWSGGDDAFAAWAQGRTGYPVVDAGMRELNATGFMHNRARLLTACFLIKDLHVDWRRGEAHFMRMLLDGDVAQNAGNWQWIASVGVDPAPFQRRLYNPALQQERHDPTGAYVDRWVPEHDTPDYPAPIVDHAAERKVAVAAYESVRA